LPRGVAGDELGNHRAQGSVRKARGQVLKEHRQANCAVTPGVTECRRAPFGHLRLMDRVAAELKVRGRVVAVVTPAAPRGRSFLRDPADDQPGAALLLGFCMCERATS
jgi:hypothetical protein